MILAIINIVCVIVLIAVSLYIFLEYLEIKKNLEKMKKAYDDGYVITDIFKDIKVPPITIQPTTAPTNTTVPTTTTTPTTTVPTTAIPYTPPNELNDYYGILTKALSTFVTWQSSILPTIQSPTFASNVDAKAFLEANSFLKPIIVWYIYENSSTRAKLPAASVQEMYNALSYNTNPAYFFKTTTGETYHFSTLALSYQIQKFYETNKLYLDSCTASFSC